jgi:type II restriction enzyme
MKQYISPDNSKTFSEKAPQVQELINITLYILETFGIPLDASPRRLERMAIAFLANGDIKKVADFKKAKE